MPAGTCAGMGCSGLPEASSGGSEASVERWMAAQSASSVAPPIIREVQRRGRAPHTAGPEGFEGCRLPPDDAMQVAHGRPLTRGFIFLLLCAGRSHTRWAEGLLPRRQ